MNKIDLHIHSCHSDDGEWSVEQIVDESLAKGMKTIAVTDHNSVAGVKAAIKYGRDRKLNVIAGIEMDCTDVTTGTHLHVLGYHIDPEDGAYIELEEQSLAQERRAGFERIDRLNDVMGLNLKGDEIERELNAKILTGEVIAEYLLKQRRFQSLEWLKPYRERGRRSDMPYVNFYWDYCAQGTIGYVPMAFPTLTEAITIIKDSGGLPVLAHPGKSIGKDSDLLCTLMAQGIMGLEVFCSYHNEEDSRFYYDLALSRGWLMSLGSDFHGKNKPLVQIGDCGCNIEDSCCFTGSLVLKYSC